MGRPGESVITVEERDDVRGRHVTLRGRLDRSTAADVRLALRRSIADGASPLHLDLGGILIGDATGVGVLVEALRCARRARRPMRVVAADDRTRRLMRRARLGAVLTTGADPDAGPEHRVLTGATG